MGQAPSKQKFIYKGSSGEGSHVVHEVFWEEHADAVSVIVQKGGEDVARYPCQRAVLMKYAAGLAKKMDKAKKIVIANHEPEIVEHILRYVNQKPVELDDWETARDIRALAWECGLWKLNKKCERFLATSVTIGNACYVMEIFLKLLPVFDDKPFEAIDEVCKNFGFAVINTKAFTQVSEDAVTAIASMEDMNVKDERSVLDALLKWARAKSIRETRPLSEESIVEGIKNVIHRCVGFEFMTVGEKTALPEAVQNHFSERITRNPNVEGLPENSIQFRRSLALPSISMFTEEVFFKTTKPATQFTTQGTLVCCMKFSLCVDTYLLGFSIACLKNGKALEITADSLKIRTIDGRILLEQPVDDRDEFLSEGVTGSRIASVYDSTELLVTTFDALQVIPIDAGVIYQLEIESFTPNIKWPLVELQANMSKYGRYMLQHSRAYGLLNMKFLDTD